MEYTLIQQTPIIHFQHDQKGATLRATEVKPKLDKFLIKYFPNEIQDSWKNKDCETALNYKLRFEVSGKQHTVELDKANGYDIFYGNMGQEKDNLKKGVIGNVKMTVVCMIPELMMLIDKNISAFFVTTNFGTMQNKGFGSYKVKEKDVTKEFIVFWLKKISGAVNCYCFDAGQTPFCDIKTLYGVMKSGHNFNRNYHRSYLFEYCHDEYKMGNEKAAMKKEGVSPYDYYDGNDVAEPVRHPQNKKAFWDQSNHPYMYVRALLGIGESIEYISKFVWGQNKKGKMTWLIDGKEKIEIKSSEIARCASPIRFKIIDDTVYMFANRIDNNIFKKQFTFTNKKTKESINLSTPKNFDIDKFLDWFVEVYNKDSERKNQKDEYVTYSIRKKIIKMEEVTNQ